MKGNETPTLWTVRGPLKSLPPCSRNPQGVLKASRCRRTLISRYGADILASVVACEEAAYIAMLQRWRRLRSETAALQTASPGIPPYAMRRFPLTLLSLIYPRPKRGPSLQLLLTPVYHLSSLQYLRI